MQILVKQIDTLKSQKHKNKTIFEYIVYLMVGSTPIKAYAEIGTNMVNERIQKILLENNDKHLKITHDYNN